MTTDIQQVVTLFVFFLGVALCFVRWPQADRWHVVLCFIAAGLWLSCLLLEPRTRTGGFGFIVVSFLVIGLSRPWKQRREKALAG
jgi:hypothetical protein